MKSLIFILIILFSTLKLYAGPPFLTDDPVPVELDHWEFYCASQSTWSSNSFEGTLPHFEVNYGALNNLQLHLVIPLNYSYLKNEKSIYSLSSVELGFKYRFIEETVNMPQIGIFPLFEVPTANNHYGSENLEIYLPIWLQKSFGEWTTYGGGGFWYVPNDTKANSVYAGWLLQRDFSKTITLGGELYYQHNNSGDNLNSFGFNVGGFINISESYHIIYSIGKIFLGGNSFTGYFGLLMTL